jgi:hypothetical protein
VIHIALMSTLMAERRTNAFRAKAHHSSGLMDEGESDVDVDILGPVPSVVQGSDAAAAADGDTLAESDPVATMSTAEHADVPQVAEAAEGEADANVGAAGPAEPVKRGRGRPRKNFTTPALPAGPKRGPGRPRNSELLARFANSHRPPGAPPLLAELLPSQKAPGAGKKKKGKKRSAQPKAESPQTDRHADAARSKSAAEKPSRLRNVSGPHSAPPKGASRSASCSLCSLTFKVSMLSY